MTGDGGWSISRRTFLIGAPAALTAAACRPRPQTTVNVRDHGASGTGVADDSDAIRAATALIKPGERLYFPSGTYRFALRDPPGDAAVALSGISDVVVEFASGAELVMDNLDPDTGHGTSHGILVRGPASRVSLRNVTVRWATPPSARSHGDGIRIVGYPAEDGEPRDATVPSGPVSVVSLTDCRVASSPQAGVILMGVSDITVAGLRVRDTKADGLHFNACRRAKVTATEVTRPGDDGLALVTYHADTFQFDPQSETFAFPDLTDWSNADTTVDDVYLHDGTANGIRLAGAHRVKMSNVTVRGHKSGSGVIVDSAAPGVEAGWRYVASKHIRLDGITVEECDIGIQVLARPSGDADARFTAFLVDANDIDVRACTNWSLRAESLTDQVATGLRFVALRAASGSTSGGNGGVGLQNTRGVSLQDLSIEHQRPARVFVAAACRELAIGAMTVTLAGDEEGPTVSSCVTFQASDGRVDALQVTWPAAPPSWIPVDTVGEGGCSAVEVERLSVSPATVARTTTDC